MPDKKGEDKGRIDPLSDRGKFNENINKGGGGSSIEKGQKNYSDIGGRSDRRPSSDREDITDSTGPMRTGDNNE